MIRRANSVGATLEESRRRAQAARDLFEVPQQRVSPTSGYQQPSSPKSAPVEPVYVGPIPDIATIGATPARALPRRISIISRRAYSLAVSASMPDYAIPLAPLVDTRDWTSGLLVVRTHAAGVLPTGASATVKVVSADRSADDPSLDFESATLAFCFLDQPAPILATDAFSSVGAGARVKLALTTKPTTPTTTWAFTISVSLVGRRR